MIEAHIAHIVWPQGMRAESLPRIVQMSHNNVADSGGGGVVCWDRSIWQNVERELEATGSVSSTDSSK